MSLPVRGAWVEIKVHPLLVEFESRSPCGERGLKLPAECVHCMQTGSLPVRGAWVEIGNSTAFISQPTRSLPVRGAWVEMLRKSEQPKTR